MVPDNACLVQAQAARDQVHIEYSVKSAVSPSAPQPLLNVLSSILSPYNFRERKVMAATS
jgi:hypothetical protein